MKVYPKHWNENRAKEGAGLLFLENNNNRLLNERLSIFDIRFDEFKRLVSNGIAPLDKEVLKEYILTGTVMPKKQKKEKIDIAMALMSYLDKDTSIKDGTKSNYARFINSFGEFLSANPIDNYADITMDLMKAYQSWCIENTKGKNGGRASGESVNKKVECTLMCIKRYLVGNGLMTGSQYADIQVEPLKEVNIDDEIALLDDELNLLYKYQCENKRDEEIRDLFLLECTTGQRFSDIKKVDDLVEHKDGRTYINLVQEKGGAKVQVDIIFQMALEILEKYNYRLPTHNKKIFNKRIKEIAKSAGINGQEMIRYHQANVAGVSNLTKERYDCISSHTGRRTFTTMLSLRGLNDTQIARYTGHASLTMVRRYDKSKEGTKIKSMFERLKVEHPESILKIVDEHGENNSSANTPNVDLDQIIKVVRENEQSKLKIERLENDLGKTIREASNKVQQQRHYYEIEKQLVELEGKSANDRTELFENLMKMGFSYDDYLLLQKERRELEIEIEKADAEYDTLLDD